MSKFRTPGVFIEEVSKFPPSVAQVETAIPTFIGYTEKAPENTESDPVGKKITSLLEYETYFGTAKKESIHLKDTPDGLTLLTPDAKFLMYYSLQMFFANGGGACYIVSAGIYTDTDSVELGKLQSGLKALEKIDDSAIVVFPDAVSLDQDDFYTIYQDALTEVAKLKNWFVIFDTYYGNSTQLTNFEDENYNTVDYFREKINASMHAATYYPHLKTVLNYSFDEKALIVHSGVHIATGPFYSEAIAELTGLRVQAETEEAKGANASKQVFRELLEQVIAVVDEVNVTADIVIDILPAQQLLHDIKESTTLTLSVIAEETVDVIGSLIPLVQGAKDLKGAADGLQLEQLKASGSVLYNQIKKEIESLNVVLPPSSAIAGMYAKVDSTKGVWKAPANIGLNYVVAPTEKISDSEQANLNDDVLGGKSINAIRTFTGKGTLVWGARTLDANSTEWRYISVRRFFDMVEKSVGNASQKFLFEVNDASTWVKAKAMIENYLNQLWMSGALAGTTPEQAYYVKVGLNETISTLDVQEGRMNIEIGMAAVRPAEFIVLRFSHKLQEA